MADNFQINDPVLVVRKNNLQLEGVIAFLGPVSFAQGDDWVGVRLTGSSVGLGRNDGSVHGQQYFECPPQSGLFVKKAAVTLRTLSRLEDLRLRRELVQKSKLTPRSSPRIPVTPGTQRTQRTPRTQQSPRTPRSSRSSTRNQLFKLPEEETVADAIAPESPSPNNTSLQDQIDDLQSKLTTTNSEVERLRNELKKTKEEGIGGSPKPPAVELQYQTMDNHSSTPTASSTTHGETSLSEIVITRTGEEPNENSGPSFSFLKRGLQLLAAPVLDEEGGAISVVAGLFSLFLIGGCIGMILPKNQDLPTPWYQTVSAGIGWIYFLCWSVSFYPQVISNFKRRTTQGLSADFCGLNVLGFACYSAYNVAFFWSDTIRHLYKERYGEDAEITVQSNDVAFALHALFLSTVTFIQIGCYNGLSAQRPSVTILVVLIVFLVIIAGYPCMIVINAGGQNFFNWLDYLYTLSTIKIMISLIKYIPQGM